MKTSSILALLLAGPVLASPCKPKPPASSVTSSVSPAFSTSSAIAAPSSSAPPTPASSSAPVAVPSSATASAPALPSSSSGSSTTNPGQVCDSTINLFVDGDISSTDLPSWPHDTNKGSPTYTRSTNCSIYPACIDIGLVAGGGAQDVDFHQSVTVISGASYAGRFFYRMSEFTASGKAMATLTCTANGVTKFTKTLCEGEESVDWKQVSFTVTPDTTDLVFKCEVSTSAVGAKFQFSDFSITENC